MFVRKLVVALVVMLLGISLSVCIEKLGRGKAMAQEQSGESQTSEEHSAWVAQSITQMETVKEGMTRDDLLKVFTTEGGLSTSFERTYVYRQCPFFKVRVEFDLAGQPALDSEGRDMRGESGSDVIKKISQPYLERQVID